MHATSKALHEGWTVRAVGDLSEVPSRSAAKLSPAQVPGCVTTDLLRAGKIADPYLDDNEFKTRWIGHTDWEYRSTSTRMRKSSTTSASTSSADGLDTVATIELNGTAVAQTQNMHRGYRFDVRTVAAGRARTS